MKAEKIFTSEAQLRTFIDKPMDLAVAKAITTLISIASSLYRVRLLSASEVAQTEEEMSHPEVINQDLYKY